jgi:hypothetical protein
MSDEFMGEVPRGKLIHERRGRGVLRSSPAPKSITVGSMRGLCSYHLSGGCSDTFAAPCTIPPPWLEYPQRMTSERKWQVGIRE